MAELETAWLEDWVFREVRDWEPARNFSWTKASTHLGAVFLSVGKICRHGGMVGPYAPVFLK